MRLTASVQQALRNEPEILKYLEDSLQRPEFEADYTPQRMDVLFDDVLFISHEIGKPPYVRPMPEGYEIPFTEIRFDNEIALFAIQGEVVINRVRKMAALDAMLSEFVSVPEAVRQ